MSYWSENNGHGVQRGDAILPRTGSDESPAVLEDSVVGMISSGGPRYGPVRLQRRQRKWSLIRSVGTLFGGRWRGADVHDRPSVGVGIVL